jgi:hypothetical protein
MDSHVTFYHHAKTEMQRKLVQDATKNNQCVNSAFFTGFVVLPNPNQQSLSFI